MLKSPPGRAAFAFIFVTVVLDMLALGVTIPVLPKLIVELQGGDLRQAAGISGTFMFVWAAMQFLFAPVLGALSDRFGRRPVVLLSNLGLGLDSILLALAPSMGWFFIGRLISGITAASFPTAAAYVSDVTPPEERAGRFGMLGAAFGLGFIIGPAFGGFLGSYGLRWPFWASAVLGLANATYGYFILPESLPPENRRPFSWQAANPLGSMKFLGSIRGMLRLTAAQFLFYLAHESLPAVFVLYTFHRYGWTEQTVGFVLTLVGISTTLVSAVLVAPTVARLGERGTALGALGCGIGGFAIYGLATTGKGFLCGIPLVALWTMTGPSVQAIMSREVDPTAQGQLQGAISSLRGITGMIGPLVFTQAFVVALSGANPTAMSGAPYLLAATMLVLSLALCMAGAPRRQSS